jgi:hypothetical protein
MENVARAGGIENFHLKRSGVMELGAIKGKDTFVSESRRGETTGEASLDERERTAEIVVVGQAAWDVATDDKVVDVRKQGSNTGVKVVEIGDDRNARSVSPSGGGCGSSGVVAVDEKGASGSDPFALEFVRTQSEARIAFPEHGALTCGIDQNEGLLARTGGGEELCFDTAASEFSAVHPGCFVVSEFPDVASAQSPSLAGDHSGGDLAARENGGGFKRDLGAAFGMVRERDERVGRVQADADDVYVR